MSSNTDYIGFQGRVWGAIATRLNKCNWEVMFCDPDTGKTRTLFYELRTDGELAALVSKKIVKLDHAKS